MRFQVTEIYENKEKEKLSVRDKKLIQLLIQNARAPISELAKKIGISKPAIVQKIESLKTKNILLYPVTYVDISVESASFYLFEISTQIDIDKSEINKKLLEIEGISALLWYSGNFNLLLTVSHNSPQSVIEKIDEIILVNRLRIRKCTGNWFHPPHVFDEIKDVRSDFTRNRVSIDGLDKKILNYLIQHPKSTLLELSENTKSSILTVKNRLNKLISNKSILGFSNFVNLWACGLHVVSVSFIVKGIKNTDKVIKKILEFPQTGNVWEFDHEWNVNAVFWVRELSEADKIINTLKKECNSILDIESMILLRLIGK